MREPERTTEYRKDPEQEQQLKNLNALLAPLEEGLISTFDKLRFPVVFIVGAPRSGTTLLAQILSQTALFSYVSNFVARFWMAPYIGTLIEDSLGIHKSESHEPFVSRFGVTKSWTGPHEFGYFWSRWFHFNETHKLTIRALGEIDRHTLLKELAAIESVYNKPLFFKNLTCGLQMAFLGELIEKSLFVLCHRHPVYNMQSLMMARKSIFGDRHHWCSLRPKEYPELLSLSPYEQVAGQVYYTLKDVEANSSSLGPDRFLEIRYEDLCSQPRVELNKILDVLRKHGVSINPKPDAIPEQFNSTNNQRVSDEEFQQLYSAAIKFFNERQIVS